MKKIEAEEIIIKTLGLVQQRSIYNQVIEKYISCYAKDFGGNLDDVERVRDATYKLIIALAIFDFEILRCDVELHNRKILSINIEEFKQEYKEYIDEMKEVVKKIEETKEELEKEFSQEDIVENT